jgi:hypothetical protein
MSKDERIVIDLTNGFGIFSTELIETQYDKEVSMNKDQEDFMEELQKNVCIVCHGVGVLQGGPNRPSVACGNCHGSGKEEKKICIRCHGTDKNCTTCQGKGRGYTVEELKEEDTVNHPKHYTFGTIEVITVIEDWQLGFHEGNCIKYIARAKHKGNELENLKKAQWYLNRKIKDIELEIAAADDK